MSNILEYAKFISFAIIAILVILLLACGYVKAPPDQAYIISGLGKKSRILIGQAGIRIPFLERLDSLNKNKESLESGLPFTPDARYPDYDRNQMVRHVLLRLAL